MDGTRHLLQTGIQQIAQLPPGTLDVGPFNSFRRGVTHASSGRDGSPEELLSDLEPKAVVLRYLLEVHKKKTLYRKQVKEVFSVLLQVPAWVVASRADADLCSGLPEDISALAKEMEDKLAELARTAPPEPEPAKAPQADAEPAKAMRMEPEAMVRPLILSSSEPGMAAADPGMPSAAPGSSSMDLPPPTCTEVRRAVDAGWAAVAERKRAEARRAEAGTRVSLSGEVQALQLLRTGRDQIEALDFSAACCDESIAAFETFGRAVAKVAHSRESQGSNPLEDIDPKGSILDFLLDFCERHRKYRSRVSAVLARLMSYDGWKVVATADPSLQKRIQGLIIDIDAPDATAVAAAVAAQPPAPSVIRKWVVWMTVDPRGGSLQPYPAEVSRRLEAGRRDGSEVVDLGRDFFGAKVELQRRLRQVTAKGSRDVVRAELSDPCGKVAVKVIMKADWRLAPDIGLAGAEDRQMAVPRDVAVEVTMTNQ